MAEVKKETRPPNASMAEIRARYREILKEFASSERIPGIELVAETCHGGQFCHGGTGKTLDLEELIRQRLEQTAK